MENSTLLYNSFAKKVQLYRKCPLYHPLSQKTLIYNNDIMYKAVNRATYPLFLTTKKLAAKDRTSILSRQTGQRFVAVRNQSVLDAHIAAPVAWHTS